MLLTMREQERLMIHTAAEVAWKRRERGLKLNLPEATAIITQFLLEGARDGRAKADLQNAAREVLSRDDVMDGVPEMLHQVHVEATFPDGTKLLTVPEPIR
jgi:urease subunit gamma